MDEPIDITYFVPCLNEELRVVPTIQTVYDSMQGLPFTYEIIVVDDGSKDGTSRIVEEFSRQNSTIPIRLQRHERNLGLAHRFVDTAFMGRGRYYRLICGDNVEPKESMLKVVSEMGKADIIIPYYTSVEGKSQGRLALSNFYTALVNLVSGYKLHYYNGNPLYLREKVMRWAPHNYGFGYQADLLTQLLDQNSTYLEVPIAGRHSNKGKISSLRIRNFMSVAHSLVEITLRRVRRMLFGR